MPIFEYECKECRTAFELLVRSDTKVACPSCESERVVKRLSLFAAHTKKSSDVLPACHTGERGCDLGRCGSGFCGVE
jgi:putative FmdB family regulatory protein